MKIKKTKYIIQTFFGKRFSQETQMRFRYWFRSEGSEAEKESVLQDIWESSPSEISSCTWSDLSEMQERIERNALPVRPTLFRGWIKYAAAVAVILVTIISTRLLTPPDVRVVSPELVEFFVPYGDCQQIRLADGSLAWVNAGSLLVYPKEFTTGTRTVYLSGEARFEVAKDPDKPFIVSTHHIDVQALGTVFSVEAYSNAGNTITTLEEGSVRVHTKPAILQSSVLKPNEQLVYIHKTGQVTINKVDAYKAALWKDGYLIFEDSSFEQLVSALERKYNVTINYDAKKYRGRSYFVKFNPDESLEDALLILSQLIENFKYKITDKRVIIN